MKKLMVLVVISILVAFVSCPSLASGLQISTNGNQSFREFSLGVQVTDEISVEVSKAIPNVYKSSGFSATENCTTISMTYSKENIYVGAAANCIDMNCVSSVTYYGRLYTSTAEFWYVYASVNVGVQAELNEHLAIKAGYDTFKGIGVSATIKF